MASISMHPIVWKEWQKGDDDLVAKAINQICSSTEWICERREISNVHLRTGYSTEDNTTHIEIVPKTSFKGFASRDWSLLSPRVAEDVLQLEPNSAQFRTTTKGHLNIRGARIRSLYSGKDESQAHPEGLDRFCDQTFNPNDLVFECKVCSPNGRVLQLCQDCFQVEDHTKHLKKVRIDFALPDRGWRCDCGRDGWMNTLHCKLDTRKMREEIAVRPKAHREVSIEVKSPWNYSRHRKIMFYDESTEENQISTGMINEIGVEALFPPIENPGAEKKVYLYWIDSSNSKEYFNCPYHVVKSQDPFIILGRDGIKNLEKYAHERNYAPRQHNNDPSEEEKKERIGKRSDAKLLREEKKQKRIDDDNNKRKASKGKT